MQFGLYADCFGFVTHLVASHKCPNSIQSDSFCVCFFSSLILFLRPPFVFCRHTIYCENNSRHVARDSIKLSRIYFSRWADYLYWHRFSAMRSANVLQWMNINQTLCIAARFHLFLPLCFLIVVSHFHNKYIYSVATSYRMPVVT